MKDKDWRRLLDLMRDGTVVPVVGSRLLVDADGHSLTGRIARRLLDENDVELPDAELVPFREINQVVTRLKRQLRNPQDLYGDIDSALQDLRRDGLAVPTALQQLAQITDFRLMVTVTPDDLLAQALTDAGRRVHEIVHSPKLPTEEVTDLADWTQPSSPVQLLYLFGKVRPTPLFAIHDEDVLEYAHNVISQGSHAPTRFLNALQERNLLLIGCNFPDWLSRFILRAARKERLADQKGRREWLVEKLGAEDPFIGFLGEYSPETEVLSSVEPTQFVDELFRRWQETRAADGPVAAAAPLARGPDAQPQGALFFISYSRKTDLTQAVKLHQALRGLGVNDEEIWFDRETLEPGDDYRQRILDGIRGCRYFLPVVSRAATDRAQAFVFREWDQATQLLPEMNRRFLLPLVVDAENRPETYQQPSVVAWRERNINFGHAPDGQPDEVTLKSLQGLVRDARARG